MACVPNGVSNHVIAFYSFKNGTLTDASGNNHHLMNTTSAHAAADRNGNVDCAFSFNNISGSDEFLVNANAGFLDNLSEFSISLWYQPVDTSRSAGAFECLIGRDFSNDVTCDRLGQWSIGLYDCRKVVFAKNTSVWELMNGTDCKQSIITHTDVWSHLVATYKNGMMKIYKNGVLQESSDENDCSSQDTGGLFIGKRYTGIIDDIIIFRKSLNQQQVNSVFNMQPCCQ